jgi:hypothetical protein
MMKIVGGHYLKVTLKSILDEVQSPLTAVHGYLTSLSRSDVLMGRFYPFMFY